MERPNTAGATFGWGGRLFSDVPFIFNFSGNSSRITHGELAFALRGSALFAISIIVNNKKRTPTQALSKWWNSETVKKALSEDKNLEGNADIGPFFSWKAQEFWKASRHDDKGEKLVWEKFI